MAKKKKRKLQPHEKTFVSSLIWGMCIALLFGVLGWPREVTYEEADVTVARYDTTGLSRYNRRDFRIITTDGQFFRVSNALLPVKELREMLVPGTDIHVEYGHDWFTRLLPPEGGYVTKLTLNGQVLADNPPGDNRGVLGLMWLGLPFPLFGFLCWASGEHLLSKWKKKREKRRKQRDRHA